MSPRLARPALLLLVGVALLLQNGSVPHTHQGVSPGVYNQDHDLTLLAALHGAAALVAEELPSVLLVVLACLLVLVAGRLVAAPPDHADSRAPPAR